jgi:hypothetical protein
MTGWDYVKEYWYGKGPIGKAYYHGTSIIVYTVVAVAVVETGGVAIAAAGGYPYTAGSASATVITGTTGARVAFAGAILLAGDLALVNAHWDHFSDDEKETILAQYLASTIAGGILFAPGKAPWLRPGSSSVFTKSAADWPPFEGFHLGIRSRRTLQPGDVFDRYGEELGTFASPVGTPSPARSLPPGSPRPYHRYEVLKPIDVWEGVITPWFYQRGYGLQYQLPRSIRDLINDGCIREIP